jgi:hypothetical protein
MSDTSPEKDDPDVVRAYAILGLCATQFSALEFHIQFLLSFLHMGRELAVETVVFTRRSSFYQKISLIAELLRLRLHDQPELLKSGLSLTADLQTYRQKRNLFIHGYWLVNRFLIIDGLLRVSDTSWDYSEKETSYSAMNSIDMPLPELEALPAQIGGLIERSHNLLEALKAHYASKAPKTNQPMQPTGDRPDEKTEG